MGPNIFTACASELLKAFLVIKIVFFEKSWLCSALHMCHYAIVGDVLVLKICIEYWSTCVNNFFVVDNHNAIVLIEMTLKTNAMGNHESKQYLIYILFYFRCVISSTPPQAEIGLWYLIGFIFTCWTREVIDKDSCSWIASPNMQCCLPLTQCCKL